MLPAPRRDLHPPRKPLKSSLDKLEYNRKRYWGNREDNIRKAKEYYVENKEKVLKYQKDYVERYKEETQAYRKRWHQENKEKVIAKATKWNKRNRARRLEIQANYRNKNSNYIKSRNKEYRLRYRELAIEYYSNGRKICACCNEKVQQFLTIDHIDGGGNKHRKLIGIAGGHNFYYWLKRNNYPEGYQVLCMNCNHAKGIFGICPHQNSDTTIPL